ncbi:UNVERIFIED_ORG: hypothetical protein M2435_001243 [Rhizobium sophorae]|uniref:hypothetical protein n=1 Tax=Rhizobium leguminosarum TaxID=384 RepID=UPI0016117328|nr:hypothetical protein [Rhizobium leguminosarum]MBB4520463.1 hypothetical protein [Rhizobium leguminosarum]MDH6658344.1 hypothetical protein [Rhizobium sophorae]
MERKALIAAMLPIVVILTGAKGCQTLDARAEAAAQTKGQAAAAIEFPDLPAACTAHVVRVKPKIGEKFRWINQRWEVTADNRDLLADDCAAWGLDMQTQYAGSR